MRSQSQSTAAASGRWTLGRTLGRGATATVSLGTASDSGEHFAVKSSPLSRSVLLRREESLLSSLSCPYIIPCLGFDISDDCCHLFLEFAAGGALSDLAGRLDESKIRSFTRQILLALCYLHSVGVAHCDVKGRNVLLCSDDRVKLADFGCARRIGDRLEMAMGTPAYMAPEVVRGEEQGTAGDIWSLGCTIVEMATGKSPWPEAVGAIGAIHRIALSSAVPAIPEWISDTGKDFISKCFIRDPKQRWTVEELLLHPFMAGAEEAYESLAQVCSSSKQNRWVSPKSTLECGLWDSEAEEDEEDESKKNSSERIRQLESPPANWLWDDSWLTVRGTPGECHTIAESKFEEESSGERNGYGSVPCFKDSMDGKDEACYSPCFTGRVEVEDLIRSCNRYVCDINLLPFF